MTFIKHYFNCVWIFNCSTIFSSFFSSILDAAYVRPSFSLSRFAKNAQKAGLSKTLIGEGSFTVFAPRNVAFFDVDFNGLNKEALKKVMLRHIVPSEIRFEAMKEGSTELTSMDGSKITLTKEGNKATITTSSGTAKIKKFDILAKNGVIHIIDKVV